MSIMKTALEIPAATYSKTHAFVLLAFVALCLGFSSCVEDNPSPDQSLSIKGGQTIDTVLFSSNFRVSFVGVNDQRCFMNPTAMGDYGLTATLAITSLNNCKNDTCRTDTIQLFLPNCGAAPLASNDVFSNTNRQRKVSTDIFNMSIGISDATPQQRTTPPIVYKLSDYQLKLFVRKP